MIQILAWSLHIYLIYVYYHIYLSNTNLRSHIQIFWWIISTRLAKVTFQDFNLCCSLCWWQNNYHLIIPSFRLQNNYTRSMLAWCHPINLFNHSIIHVFCLYVVCVVVSIVYLFWIYLPLSNNILNVVESIVYKCFVLQCD